MPQFNPDIVARFIGEIRKAPEPLENLKVTFPGIFSGKP